MEPNLIPGPQPGPGRQIRVRDRANPVARALERSQLLDPDDLRELRAIPFREAAFVPGQVVLDETERAGRVLVVTGGFAAVQTDFPDGTRQITDLLVAGDVYGLGAVLGPPADSSVAAVAPLSVASLATADLAAALSARPRVCAALLWAAHRRERILRDHVRIVGRRNARKRLAHLLCCLQARRAELDGGSDDPFRLDVTHCVLADAIGMTTVHVGRILRELSREHVVRTGRCGIAVVNGKRLRAVAELQGLH